ncbi:hypothetical protein BP5796_07008 [Coleophoma crateriformis]|uniref:Uncharacterized protein n=1 Tax=Coleophoma crateriformis TaxID=565419 RepID=A0A3D8RQ30_9HELO|nr:hypothetical protein BP5796_07008 [Coleophoma crateriformis]
MSSLLLIPRELREQIFSHLLYPTCSTVTVANEGSRQLKSFDLRFLLTCSQIRAEALSVFRHQNTFIRICTPFAEAEHWVSFHGTVPLVRIKGDVNKFSLHHLDCRLDVPHAAESRSTFAGGFVVLLEDLELFTQHWFYTNVTNPGQNGHLRLTLHLKHPYAAAHDEDTIPKRVQRLLLRPFGRIKGLEDFRIIGHHLSSVEREVREEQAVPSKTARECLEDTTRLKDEGNVAYKGEKWDEALQLYIKAFAAMYIICNGRRRSVWGDAWFQTSIDGGQYDGQFAQQVRIVLRVNLVANVVATFLKLKNYEEARFWGMRTIDLVRDSTGQDEVILNFPGAEGLGKIFFRTGMACIELGDKAEARRLLRIAAMYRPNDTIVKNALASVALKLG